MSSQRVALRPVYTRFGGGSGSAARCTELDDEIVRTGSQPLGFPPVGQTYGLPLRARIWQWSILTVEERGSSGEHRRAAASSGEQLRE